MKTYHIYETELFHHDFEVMGVDITQNHNGIVSYIKVDDGKNSRIGLTLAELRAIVELAEKFERANEILEKGENQ